MYHCMYYYITHVCTGNTGRFAATGQGFFNSTSIAEYEQLVNASFPILCDNRRICMQIRRKQRRQEKGRKHGGGGSHTSHLIPLGDYSTWHCTGRERATRPPPFPHNRRT